MYEGPKREANNGFSEEEKEAQERRDLVLELIDSKADVKVLRSSGELEDGWRAVRIEADKVLVVSQRVGLEKTVPAKDFLAWQSEKEGRDGIGSHDLKESRDGVLEKRILSAQNISELLSVIRSVDGVVSSSGQKISSEMIAHGIESLAYKAPEQLSSRDAVEEFLSQRGVTRSLGIREKAIDLFLSR